MTDEIRPDRLDDLFDGHVTPETDEERDFLHLAAELRAAAPPAPDHLRERIEAMGEPPRTPTAGYGWWSRIRWRFAAPAVAGLIAVLVAVTIIPRGGTDVDSDAVSQMEQPPTGDFARDATGGMMDRARPSEEGKGAEAPPSAARPAPTVPETSATTSEPPPSPPLIATLRAGTTLEAARTDVTTIVREHGGRITDSTGTATRWTVTAALAQADRPALFTALQGTSSVAFDATDIRATITQQPTVRIQIVAP